MHNQQHADVASLFIKPAGCVQCKVVLCCGAGGVFFCRFCMYLILSMCQVQAAPHPSAPSAPCLPLPPRPN